ncbi:hypothetical protein ABPG74_006525 [Tetrahymena malaccensis]
MRFSVFLLIVILSIASFAQGQSEKNHVTSHNKNLKPVKFHGKNGIKMKCSPLEKGCKCWDCSAGYVLQCKYTCL